MKIIGRILACVCAFVLALTVLGSYLAGLASHAVHSSAFYKQPAEQMRADQMARMKALVGSLSEKYGFDSETVMEQVSADDLSRYGDEVLAFLASLLKEQEEDAEMIFPYYMTENLVDVVRDDVGFQATVDKGLQRTVSQNDIVTPIEQAATRLVFPVRPQLVIAGYNTVSESVNIPDAVALLGKWWILPLAGAVLILLILLFDHKGFMAWTGSGLTAGALMLFAFLGFLHRINAAASVGQINQLFSKYLLLMWHNVWTTAGVCGGAVCLIGLLLIFAYVMHARKRA